MRSVKLLLSIFLVVAFLVSPTFVFAATLKLSPSAGTFNRGCSFSLDLMLDTLSEKTDGTDVTISFNPAQLSVSSLDKGDIYPDYPSITYQNSTGSINISGLASVDSPFTGSGKFARVNFSVKSNAPAGATNVNFAFDPNDTQKTTDSNVVKTEEVVDILTSVTNGTYTVGTGVCGAVGSSPITPDKGGTPSADLDDITGGGTPPGVSGITLILSIVGSFLVILGIAGLALL